MAKQKAGVPRSTLLTGRSVFCAAGNVSPDRAKSSCRCGRGGATRRDRQHPQVQNQQMKLRMLRRAGISLAINQARGGHCGPYQGRCADTLSRRACAGELLKPLHAQPMQ